MNGENMEHDVYVTLLHNALQMFDKNSCLHIKRGKDYKTWSYADFHRDLNRLTFVLKKHGMKKGVNAAVIGENTPEWVIAYHSAILTGGCIVPIDPNIPPTEIEEIVSITQCKIVFCSRVYLSLFQQLKAKHHFIDKIVLLDPKEEAKVPTFYQYLEMGKAEKDAFGGDFEPDNPMVIIFTSGTTGRSKGVVLTQRNYVTVSRHAIPRMHMTADDTVVAVLPLHHVFGFAACIAGPLIGGMDVVFVPYIKGPLILEALRDKGVTMLPAVPKMIALFYDSILHNVKKKGVVVRSIFSGLKTVSAVSGSFANEKFRRSLFSSVHKSFGGNLRMIISGGATLGKKYWNGFRLMGFDIVEGYGLTETFGPITLCPAESPRLGSVGPILPDNEIKIMEPNEAGIGEVLLRGNCLFRGYYNNETLTNEVIDQDGWFHTGDLGRLDKDGYLYIVGRKKDMIVLGSGKNVYPDELEEYYSNSPIIEEIGVFGIQKPEGEIVAAAIVPQKEIRKQHSVKDASDLLHNELTSLGKRLPVYRRINDFITVYQPLPRTTTRKLKKPELIRLYNSIKRRTGTHPVHEDQLSVVEIAMMESKEYKEIVTAITSAAPKTDPHIITPRSHLEIDLDLDSLQRIELLSYLEENFAISVPEEVFDKMETVGDLVSLIKERASDGEPATVEKIMNLKERILAEPFEQFRFPEKRNIFHQTMAPFFKTTSRFWKLKTSGTEHLRDLKPPIVFAANHIDKLDAFYIFRALPPNVQKSTYHIVTKDEQHYPKLAYNSIRTQMIHPEKCGDPIELLKTALAVVKNARNLLIFPEGAISISNAIGEFKTGISLIAQESGATIVPTYIGKNIPGTNGILVYFGKPFTLKALINQNGITHESTPEAITGAIRSRILELTKSATTT